MVYRNNKLLFRLKYYDEKETPITILNSNQDSFVRRGYYGGHVDTYIPYGENLYYLSHTTLTHSVMKSK